MLNRLFLLGLCVVLTGGCGAAFKATAENQYDWTDRYEGVSRMKEIRRRTLPMKEISGLAWDPANRGIWMVNDGRRLKAAFLKDPLGADQFDADAHDLSRFEMPKSRDQQWAEWPDFEAVDVEQVDGKTRLWVASEMERQAWRFDLETKKVDEVVSLPRPLTADTGTLTECSGSVANRQTEGLALARTATGRVFYSANERCPAEIIKKEEKPDRLTRFTQPQIERALTDYMLARWKPPTQQEGGPKRGSLGERYLCPGVPKQEAAQGERLCKAGSITDLAWQEDSKRLWVLFRQSRIVAAIDWRDKPVVAGLWSFLGKVDETGSAVRFGNAEGLAVIPPDPANGFKGALFVATDPGDKEDSQIIGFELPEAGVQAARPAAPPAETAPQKVPAVPPAAAAPAVSPAAAPAAAPAVKAPATTEKLTPSTIKPYVPVPKPPPAPKAEAPAPAPKAAPKKPAAKKPVTKKPAPAVEPAGPKAN